MNGRMRFVQNRFERRVVHQHRFGRMFDVDLKVVGFVSGELLEDDFAIAHQDDFNSEIASGEHSAFDRGFGGEISAHRVERDYHSSSLGKGLFLSVGQLAPTVGTAMTAYAMRH